MALFVLGAGATRGCSFVPNSKRPCQPPLDADFFTQLQRVTNPKHQKLITAVMKDVVELFGHNFTVTMETAFATLDQTIRMVQATRERRRFKSEELKAKRSRLMEALHATFEESLTQPTNEGKGSRAPSQCKYHKHLIKSLLRPGDTVISFNYDCVIDYSLQAWGKSKWSARYGYGVDLGARGTKLVGDGHWSPDAGEATKEGTIRLLKLHGSLHFIDGPKSVQLKQRPYTKQHGTPRFSIIPPEAQKDFGKGLFPTLWKKAADAIYKAEHIVVIGYSFPATDLHSSALFRTNVRPQALKSLVVVNPDQAARVRTRAILQAGLGQDTRVLSFNTLKDLTTCTRRLLCGDIRNVKPIKLPLHPPEDE